MLTAAPSYKLSEYSETPLDDFLNEMSQSRESFENPEPHNEIINSPAAEIIPEKPEIPELTEKERESKRQFTARFLGKNTDKAFAFLGNLIAEGDNIDDWKASPEDLQDVIECYYEMCVSYGWTGLPPWMNLVLCLSFTYAPILIEAKKTRGINKEITRKASQAIADRIIAEDEVRRLKEKEAERLKTAAQSPVPDTKTENNISDGKPSK